MAASKMLISSLTHFRPLTCAAAASYPMRLVPHPPDLLKWVKREGGFVHKAVKITQDITYGLGLVTSGEIPKGFHLIVLPDHVALKFQSDNEDGAGFVLLHLSNQVHEELWEMKLGLKLLRERAKVGSFWWPNISNLPETYSVPIFFAGEYKKLAICSSALPGNRKCQFLLEFEQEVKNALKNLKPSEHPFGGQDVDASSLGWAMSAVSSRAFRLYVKKLPDGTHSDIPMMLPLIDMCNHSFNPNAQILQEHDAGNPKMLIKVGAEREIKQNDPLLLNYGCLSNDFFLLDYGFLILSNPYDYIELKYDGTLMDAASIFFFLANMMDAASMAAGVSSPNFS